MLGACSICPLARCLLGGRLYRKFRTPLVLTTRLLAMHGAVRHRSEDGLQLSSFSALAVQLLFISGALSQVWVGLGWQLPLPAHVVAVVLSAREFISFAESNCRAAFSADQLTSSSLPVSPEPAGPQSDAGTSGAAAFLNELAAWMDWPFMFLLPTSKRVINMLLFPGPAALCATALTWAHLTFGVVGTTVELCALKRYQENQAGAEGEAVSSTVGRGSAGDGASQGPGSVEICQPPPAMFAYAVFASQALWCVLRVVYLIKPGK